MKGERGRGRNQPLRTEVKGGLLVISIGVETLAHAVYCSPDERLSPYDEQAHDWRHTRVTDTGVFALEVARALNDEQEDGTTPLHLLLDNAAVAAIEDGAEGVAFEPELPPPARDTGEGADRG